MTVPDFTFSTQPDTTQLCSFAAYTVLNIRCLNLVVSCGERKPLTSLLKHSNVGADFSL
jgi:hypothetical protein